jgi:hypothetical protein
MSTGYRALCAVAVLVIASACGRSDDDVKLCDFGGNNCRTYASPVELDRVMAAEMARQRTLAEGLPFDYRDMLHALLIDYLQSPRLHPDEQYFVSILGRDIDTKLTGTLHEAGIEVRPASALISDDGRSKEGRVVPRVQVDVSFIKQVEPDTFVVGIGYYCGGSCAASQNYTLRRRGEKWLIVDRKTHWIA